MVSVDDDFEIWSGTGHRHDDVMKHGVGGMGLQTYTISGFWNQISVWCMRHLLQSPRLSRKSMREKSIWNR